MVTVNELSVGTTARDHATWNLWKNATDYSLVASGTLERALCYDDSDFNEGLTFAVGDAITDATHYRELTAAIGEEYDPITDTGVKNIRNSNSTVNVQEPFVLLSYWGAFGSQTIGGMINLQNTTASGIVVESVYSRSINAGASAFVRGHLTYNNVALRNCIYDCAGGSQAYGFFQPGADLYNCVAYNAQRCFYGDVGEIKNCIGILKAGGWEPAFIISSATASGNNCSSDTSAPGTGSISGIAASSIFTNAAVHDFTPVSGSVIDGTGADLSAIFTTSFSNITRETSVWDMGAYSFDRSTPPTPSGTTTSPITMSMNRFIRMAASRVNGNIISIT
jgi:hypothetical protein